MRQASLSVIVFAAFSLFAAASIAAEDLATPAVPPQLQAAVDRLKAALPKWTLHQIDQQPSVDVAGLRGYRIVMRSTWKEPPAGSHSPQQAAAVQQPDTNDRSFVTRHTDWHFVLFPLGNAKLSDEAKREILWHAADEKQFRLPVVLGQGHGFAWFTFTSIPQQQFVRGRLALTGGDDPLQLALRGLSVEDEGMMTRNSVERLFATFGDQGFAALDEIVRSGVDIKLSCNAVRCMASFADARATARLAELYFSAPDKKVRQAAAYVLVSRPLRPEARPAYFDMLAGDSRVSEAMEICLELGWRDAAPLIAKVVEQPPTLPRYLQAYRTYRQLSGNPIDAKLLDAEKVIRRQAAWQSNQAIPTPADIALARRAIVESADVDGAAYVALSLAVSAYKGNNTAVIMKTGMELLRELPRPTVENQFNRLLNGIRDDSDRARVLKMSQQVARSIEAPR